MQRQMEEIKEKEKELDTLSDKLKELESLEEESGMHQKQISKLRQALAEKKAIRMKARLAEADFMETYNRTLFLRKA